MTRKVHTAIFMVESPLFWMGTAELGSLWKIKLTFMFKICRLHYICAISEFKSLKTNFWSTKYL